MTATAPVHLYALARVMSRYQNGIGAPLRPLNGVWLPAGGPLLPIVTMMAGLALLILTVLIAHSDMPEPLVTAAGAPDNGSVTPTGQSANQAIKASTTDAANH